MARVARTLEAEWAQTEMARFANGPSKGDLLDFRVGVLNFRPAPTDGPGDTEEYREEVDFAGAVIGEAEDTPLRGNGGTGEDGGFEGPEEGLFAKAGDFALDLDSPLSCRGLVAEHGTNSTQRISHDHAASV